MAADRSICWFHGADVSDDVAAHRATEHDRHVIRVRAGDRLRGGVLAGRRARHQAVARIPRVLPRLPGSRALRLSRAAAREQEVIERIARTTAITCVALALAFAIWKRNLAGPLGVLGGGV